MTSTANPDYKYYQKLEGTWKDVNGSCEAVLSRFAGIEIRYASGKLSSSYGVTDAMQLQLNQSGMMIGMMAAAYTIHDGEEIKINLNNRIVYEGDKTIYRVAEAWYGNEELHLEMMDLNDGHKEDLVLARVKEDVPLAEGEFQCSCGYRGEARRFCPNCGKEIIWKGEGKSTISRKIAEASSKSALIEGDDLYAQIVGGYVDPWEEGNY